MITLLVVLAAGLWIWAAAANSLVQAYEARVSQYAGGRAELDTLAFLRRTPWSRLLAALTRRVRSRRRTVRARWNPQEMASAGIDPARIEAGRILGGTVGAAVGAVLLALIHSAVALLLGAVCAMIGFMLPPILVGLRLQERRLRIRAALPDVLDFLAVAIEAGQSLEQALTLVASEIQGPLAALISQAQLEIHYGAPRDAALRAMGERSGVAEVQQVMGHIIRGFSYGLSLSGTLEREGQHIRALLRSRARQRSAEAAVRLLFPLVLFYIPALFLMTIGPVVVSLMASLHGKVPH